MTRAIGASTVAIVLTISDVVARFDAHPRLPTAVRRLASGRTRADRARPAVPRER